MFAYTTKSLYLCIAVRKKGLLSNSISINFLIKVKRFMMVTFLTFAVVAMMIAQAVNVENSMK